jgi:hypothetical protein
MTLLTIRTPRTGFTRYAPPARPSPSYVNAGFNKAQFCAHHTADLLRSSWYADAAILVVSKCSAAGMVVWFCSCCHCNEITAATAMRRAKI